MLRHIGSFRKRVEFGSKFGNEIGNSNAERLRDAEQGVEADPLLTAFHFADVNGMEVSLFGQFFLTHLGLFAVSAKRLSKNLALVRSARHSGETKQNVPHKNHTKHGC